MKYNTKEYWYIDIGDGKIFINEISAFDNRRVKQLYYYGILGRSEWVYYPQYFDKDLMAKGKITKYKSKEALLNAIPELMLI